MKAPYTQTVFVPKGWIALSTAKYGKEVKHSDSDNFEIPEGLDKEEWTSLFGNEAVSCFVFEESPKISVYLYSIIAGPYHEHTSEREDI